MNNITQLVTRHDLCQIGQEYMYEETESSAYFRKIDWWIYNVNVWTIFHITYDINTCNDISDYLILETVV